MKPTKSVPEPLARVYVRPIRGPPVFDTRAASCTGRKGARCLTDGVDALEDRRLRSGAQTLDRPRYGRYSNGRSRSFGSRRVRTVQDVPSRRSNPTRLAGEPGRCRVRRHPVACVTLELLTGEPAVFRHAAHARDVRHREQRQTAVTERPPTPTNAGSMKSAVIERPRARLERARGLHAQLAVDPINKPMLAIGRARPHSEKPRWARTARSA